MSATQGSEAAGTEQSALADRILDTLPQTQCGRCGWPDCAAYAQAIAAGQAPINQCPPGGAQGIAQLSAITGQSVLPLDAACGTEGPRGVAVIDEAWCIGCTLCIKACPVDCLTMQNVTGARTGWAAWSQAQADAARERYQFTRERRQQEALDHEQRLQAKAHYKLAHLSELTKSAEGAELARKRAVLEAALARARDKAARDPAEKS